MVHLTCHVFDPGSAVVIADVANLAGKGLGVKFAWATAYALTEHELGRHLLQDGGAS